MPIDLGLSRVLQLLKHLHNPQRAYRSIHVAGTNGKGLTVSYLLLILTTANISNGRFTLPHMVYYNDCIVINGEVYPWQKFEAIQSLVTEQNKLHNVGCTEFELLTVTAFTIFAKEKVDVAVIEVGLGGRLDATNILEPASSNQGGVIATGITKIARDHELLLGDTIEAIAGEKAGIIKPGVPVVVDGTNLAEVLNVVTTRADQLGCKLDKVTTTADIKYLPLAGEYQQQNLAVALGLLQALEIHLPHTTIIEGIKATRWPGRLQTLTVGDLPILLDGAHNENAAIELGKYLETNYRPKGVILVVAMTAGKSLSKLLSNIAVKHLDWVVPVTFTTPENMPWIECYSREELTKRAQKYVDKVRPVEGDNICHVLENIGKIKQKTGDDRKVVVCGSLYLCGDVLRCEVN